MGSLLATLAALALSASFPAPHIPSSPRIPDWKAGDALVVVDPGALPPVTGTVEISRSQDDAQYPEIIALGAYSRQTNASGHHTYIITFVGEPFGLGDFLKFYPDDGISPSYLIWIDPAGVLGFADTLIKAEN